ncbi:hypothetical protein [Gardnerella pickettii]|uniref:hypothetical protein n=1 Tax=Gardnerella pickettii TaxID=2914924 RepID=UPI002153A36F|nr:hypothetical protein [Gardnerella pickettii]
MMNKKAIAAFAAGATLLAGFAMATPAFAADAAKTPDQILTEDTAALAKKDTAIEAQKKTVEEKQKAVEEKQKAVDAAKLLYGQEYKEDTAGKGKEQADALKEAQTALTTEQTKLDNMYNKAYYDLKEKVAQEKADKEARDDAAYKAAHSKAHHVAVVSAAKSKLDSAAADKAEKLKTYDEKFEALEKADAALKMAQANFKAAHKAVSDAEASGLNLKDSTAYNALVDAENRASAEQTAADKDFQKANKEFGKAKSEAEAASLAYNNALEAYKAAYNAAVRDGVKLPADLPQITDPLVPTTLPGVPGVVTPAPAKPGAAAGQAGANGAAAGAKTTVVEKKKDGGKKLPGTGVGVTLTALAATMLAGMGAAVRKARH